ncbi:MAG: Uma2 family endonuclease [Limnothrix sp.]
MISLSPQEYLDLEAHSMIRHEYRQGLTYAMAGGSDDHSRIAINLLTEMNLHLRGSDCQFFSGDVKVNYADNFFYYPDAFVTCDPRDKQNRYVKQYPKLIAEVLSPSTTAFDRTEKFSDYQAIATFEEYILIAQTTQQIEVFRRDVNSGWRSQIYGMGERFTLKSIGLEMTVTDLYRGTSLELAI